MTDILNIVLLVLAIFFFVVGAYFLLRALRSRMSVSERSYGVAKQEARQVTLVNIARGVFFLILALITFAVLSILPSTEVEEPAVTIVPTTEVRPSQTAGLTPTIVETKDINTPTVTETIPSRTPFPTDTPEPSSTPDLPSATVNSPNGLWLRESPGGVQELELLPNGTILILLSRLEIADEIEWQEVRSQAGNEGWVAVDFITYDQ